MYKLLIFTDKFHQRLNAIFSRNTDLMFIFSNSVVPVLNLQCFYDYIHMCIFCIQDQNQVIQAPLIYYEALVQIIAGQVI